MKHASARGPSGVVEPPARPVVSVPQHITGEAHLHPTLESVRAGLGHDAEMLTVAVAADTYADTYSDTAAMPAYQEPQTAIIGDSAPGAGPGPEVMAADTLQGDAVVNRQGELLGKIRDIMVDVPRGRIAYVVLSSGGVMGFGDRLYALPWSALTLDADQRCFVLDADKERLRASPGFDKDHWPSMSDLSFAKSVHDYYGAASYWNY